MKTVTTFILSLTAILTLAAGSAFGAYSGGTGEPNNPYQIATNADLLALAANTGDYGKCFILTADIDMQGQVFTTAIIAEVTYIKVPNTGLVIMEGTPFMGIFDGNGHKITNFTINGGSIVDVGLFGYIDGGLIKNLGLDNFTVSGGSNSSDVGGLAGSNDGTISNCYSTGAVSGFVGVGGLVGDNHLGSISNCYSTGMVSGVSSSFRVGGLVGWNYVGNISNCYSTGSVSGSEEVGGLAGSSGGTIVSSFWDINTSGQTTSSGGTGMTTAEMKTENTFTTAGWDFATIWRMRCEGMNYPKLNWQVIPTADWVCPDGVDFADFAYFAEWWQTTGCDSSNNFCGGTDMDTSGTVDIFDLVEFAGYWLSGS
jgi:hypothetical protein